MAQFWRNSSEPPLVVEQYVSALFWAFTTFTVGIGDIVATNDAERIYCVVVMTVGTMVFTYGITSVVQAISNRNRAQKVFNEQLDELNTFMADRKLPRPMRHALREYAAQFCATYGAILAQFCAIL